MLTSARVARLRAPRIVALPFTAPSRGVVDVEKITIAAVFRWLVAGLPGTWTADVVRIPASVLPVAELEFETSDDEHGHQYNKYSVSL